MALVLKDRVKETTATTGTGTITGAGAVAGFQGLSSIGNGNTTFYTLLSGILWETGLGTYSLSGNTLSRDTVLDGSSGPGVKIALAGTSTVFVDMPAATATRAAASSLSLISTLTANNTSSTLAWTGLTGNDYLMIIRGLQPAANGTDIMLQFGTGAGPTWITTGYWWYWIYVVEGSGISGVQQGSTAGGIFIANVVDNSGGGLVGGELKMFGLSLAQRHTINFHTNRLNGGTIANLNGHGNVSGTIAKTAVRLITSAGNLFAGSASLYLIAP